MTWCLSTLGTDIKRLTIVICFLFYLLGLNAKFRLVKRSIYKQITHRNNKYLKRQISDCMNRKIISYSDAILVVQYCT